jgi:cytochrome c oxidase cbb3-type subunit I
VLLGVIGIIDGDNTGFPGLQMPRYALATLFIAYCLLAIPTLIAMITRRTSGLYVSQWYLLAALMIFPWILITAMALLFCHPAQGVYQEVLALWFQGGLNQLFFGGIALATIYYFIPKISGRQLYSHYLAVLGFWLLMLLGSWLAIPSFAPLPVWVPALGVVAAVLFVVSILCVGTNWAITLSGYPKRGDLPLRFILFGAACYVLWGLLNAATSLHAVSEITQFTLVTRGLSQLFNYGFLAMTFFGALYYIVPQLTQAPWPCAGSVIAHFWSSAGGIVLSVLALVVGGNIQGLKLADNATPFANTMRTMVPFIGGNTLGLLLLLVGSIVLLSKFHKAVCSRCCPKSSPITPAEKVKGKDI